MFSESRKISSLPPLLKKRLVLPGADAVFSSCNVEFWFPAWGLHRDCSDVMEADDVHVGEDGNAEAVFHDADCPDRYFSARSVWTATQKVPPDQDNVRPHLSDNDRTSFPFDPSSSLWNRHRYFLLCLYNRTNRCSGSEIYWKSCGILPSDPPKYGNVWKKCAMHNLLNCFFPLDQLLICLATQKLPEFQFFCWNSGSFLCVLLRFYFPVDLILAVGHCLQGHSQ